MRTGQGILLSLIGILSVYLQYSFADFTSKSTWQTWCLQAEQCVPTVTCQNTTTGGTWPICLDNVDFSDCLVYSIGIDTDWRFDALLGARGCEVHAFDPTIRNPTDLAPNVTFHYWGLKQGQTSDSHPEKTGYGVVKGELFTIDEIVSKLGHVGRRLSILKIDCEGCEWGVFESLYHAKLPFAGPDQLLVEIHLSEESGIVTEHDIDAISNFYSYLFHPHDNQPFARFTYHDNPGMPDFRTISKPLLQAGLPDKDCCRELGFLKQPRAKDAQHFRHNHDFGHNRALKDKKWSTQKSREDL